FVKELLEMIWSYKSKVIKNVIEIGADVIALGDDYAGRNGTLMSPKHFREFILPYLKKAVDITHGKGSFAIKHTDGNIWEIIDDIVNTGIDVLDPLEPLAGMDIGAVKEKYGERICLAGNIDCTMALSMGTEEEVEEAIKETIAKAAPGGGYILSSSNSIHPGVKSKNYKTMLEAARKYGKYPISENLIKAYKNKNYIKKFV
ncbi:MAG: uroporphyrinogen decarboxylase family protein, partial [Actinobacteria bacterium]|nr:uroporphyrinogen decarboxylase family protein [Actinomycetota bacterium]